VALIYCTDCGNQFSDKAAACPKCGAPNNGGYIYVPNTNQRHGSIHDQNKSDKDWVTLTVLCFFLGAFGVHYFYVGRVGKGVVFLILHWFTCGIWLLIDFIIIITGSFRDEYGRIIKSK
jgi:TM2 domain-containing membrane protein YozV